MISYQNFVLDHEITTKIQWIIRRLLLTIKWPLLGSLRIITRLGSQLSLNETLKTSTRYSSILSLISDFYLFLSFFFSNQVYLWDGSGAAETSQGLITQNMVNSLHHQMLHQMHFSFIFLYISISVFDFDYDNYDLRLTWSSSIFIYYCICIFDLSLSL